MDSLFHDCKEACILMPQVLMLCCHDSIILPLKLPAAIDCFANSTALLLYALQPLHVSFPVLT